MADKPHRTIQVSKTRSALFAATLTAGANEADTTIRVSAAEPRGLTLTAIVLARASAAETLKVAPLPFFSALGDGGITLGFLRSSVDSLGDNVIVFVVGSFRRASERDEKGKDCTNKAGRTLFLHHLLS